MRKFELHSRGIQDREYHVIDTDNHENFVMLNPKIELTNKVENDLLLMSKAPELLDVLQEILKSEWVPLAAFNETVSRARRIVIKLERGCNIR